MENQKRSEGNIKKIFVLNIRMASGLNYFGMIVYSGNIRDCGDEGSDTTAKLIKPNTMLVDTP